MISVLRRRVAHVSALTAVLLVSGVAFAGTAGAAVPEGWETPDPVDKLHALLVLAGVPLLLFVVIAVLVYLPSMIRGESLAPGTAPAESQWLGGPRKSVGELAAPDGEQSSAGGAGGTW